MLTKLAPIYFFSLFWVIIAISGDAGAQIPYQVVPLTAQADPTTPSITVKWALDTGAPFYKIRRKGLSDQDWQELATLSGGADQYVDTDVAAGDIWEYSVVRSERLPIMDTLCVAPGTNVTFTIHDSFGNGLCCWNSHGFWEVYACGELVASGAQYTFQDQHQFVMCGAAACEELVVLIYPDHQFEEISWDVSTDQGVLLGAGAPEMAPMFGYVLAGVDAPATEQQGTILIIVDQAHEPGLKMELQRLYRDLIGEGWLVVNESISGSALVTEVKQVVTSTAAIHPDLRAVMLIGHVPVPYSGVIAPDEHEDHVGAWPADLYYAELDGEWTDDTVEWEPWGIQARNHNIPGDGRFDQSTLPSDVDLMIGRIDFHDLPVFSLSEIELLRAYLDRDHAFRTGDLVLQRRAVIDENFPGLDHESAAFRSCIPMFGTDSVYQAPFISSLSQGSHLWSMAGGPGSFSSAIGIGTSLEVATTPLNGAFAHVLGSYFGDWDVQNNFLRSVLGSGTMLGVVWGLQEVAFHHMALGLPIGESIRRSQNSGYDQYERQGRLINLALMGDPTLPLFPVPQVETVSVSLAQNGVLVQWSEIPGELLGYNIYRRTDQNQHFVRLNDAPVSGSTYTDMEPVEGYVEYMVRALKRETSASGTFDVLGTGRIAETDLTLDVDHIADSDPIIFPSPNSGTFTINIPGIEEKYQVRMFDLSGAEVALEITTRSNGLSITTQAVTGMYVLQLSSAAGVHLQRSISIIR